MKKKRFVLTNIVYIFLTFADIGITYYVSPDLSMEDNFTVRELGLGWSMLLSIAIISIVIMIMITYYDCFKYETVCIEKCKYTEYYSLVCFDRPDKFWTGLMPKHIKPEFAAAGFALPWTMSFYRLWCICEWAVVCLDKENILPYSVFRKEFLAEILSVILALTLYYMWFYIEHRNSLKAERGAIYRN